jgi:hypothetical protein
MRLAQRDRGAVARPHGTTVLAGRG